MWWRRYSPRGGPFRAHREGLPEESSAVIGNWFSAYKGSAVSADAQVGAGGLQKISREYPHRGPHYITGLPDPKRINGAIRRHWGGENNLHWALDVLLHERASFKSIVFIFLLPLMGKKNQIN